MKVPEILWPYLKPEERFITCPLCQAKINCIYYSNKCTCRKFYAHIQNDELFVIFINYNGWILLQHYSKPHFQFYNVITGEVFVDLFEIVDIPFNDIISYIETLLLLS
jgi:hypothetical protein